MKTADDTERGAFRNIWVLGEWLPDGALAGVTRELAGAARRLADARGVEAWAVLLGGNPDAASGALFALGVDTVLSIADARLDAFRDEVYARQLSDLIDRHRPEAVLGGATAQGRALMPRVAVLCGCGLTADCTELDIDPATGDLLQTRPAFGGNVMATIRTANHRPQMATVRPHVFTEPAPRTGVTGTHLCAPYVPDARDARTRWLERTVGPAGVTLADARFVVAGGRGVGSAGGFGVLEAFARAVGGVVAASRAAVDAGWAPYERQVGQTGATVQPEVYLACGISGQVQHLVGMRQSDCIIAINRDPEAPIMHMADVALVGDLFEILPAMQAEMERV